MTPPIEYTANDAPMPPAAPPRSGTSEYHTRTRTPEQVERERARKARHEAKRGPRSRTVDPHDRRMIAWDGEGMKLGGERKPQHYVLFGCSADPYNPLVIKDAKDDLDFYRLADYICEIGRRFPHSFHVGYFFKYDHNMIVKSLPWPMKAALYEHNKCRTRRGQWTYAISWIPGKSITISKRNNATKAKAHRVTIDDIGPFFASSFVKAYESAFPVTERGDVWRTVVEGKQVRSEMIYEDMERVRRYWTAEIIALEKLAEWFRKIVYDAGFILTKWYGPGALANLLRKRHGLAAHEWGGKVENMPPEVHDASKRAYFGGHVEQYLAGRVVGPVYVLDVNSAYPAAFAGVPSLQEGGRWVHTTRNPSPRNPPADMSVWRVRWQSFGRSPAPASPQPLPHRDHKREITYPPMCEGWYWEPELAAVMRTCVVHKRGRYEVLEGWEWEPADETRPWDFMRDMYRQRRVLKAAGNPSEMALKLGLNSMYGKMAQRAGWDRENHTPPRSHTLPLAGYVTSWCRARIMIAVQKLMDIDPYGVVAVETDGIFTTVDPALIGVENSTELGEWSVDIYDELLYVQNGVYLLRQGDKWVKIKTRGMSAGSVTPETMVEYLRGLKAESSWEPLALKQGEVFIGLGAAISRATNSRGGIAWPKAAAIHCRWEKQSKDVVPGVRGKRIHIADPSACPTCDDGVNAAGRPHVLRVRSSAPGTGLPSQPYLLPWEREYTETEYERLDRQAADEIKPEDT